LKVLFDANVLVSILIAESASVPQLALEHCGTLKAEVLVTTTALDEVQRTLRKKFRMDESRVSALLKGIREAVEVVADAPDLGLQLPDPDDAHLFDAAVFADVDILITGDKALWSVKVPGCRLKVMSPRLFIESHS
jgi:putative PIN family toxin of toxin-antitoxin system